MVVLSLVGAGTRHQSEAVAVLCASSQRLVVWWGHCVALYSSDLGAFTTANYQSASLLNAISAGHKGYQLGLSCPHLGQGQALSCLVLGPPIDKL